MVGRGHRRKQACTDGKADGRPIPRKRGGRGVLRKHRSRGILRKRGGRRVLWRRGEKRGGGDCSERGCVRVEKGQRRSQIWMVGRGQKRSLTFALGDEEEEAYDGNDEVKVKEGVTRIVDETIVDAEEDYYGNGEEEEAYYGTDEEVEFYEEEEEYYGEEEDKKDEVVTAVRGGTNLYDWEEEDCNHCIPDYSYWHASDVKKEAKDYGNDEEEEYYGNEEEEEHQGSEEGEVHCGMEKRDEVVVKAVTAENVDDVVEIVDSNAKNEKKVVEENNATKTVTTATETGKSS